MDILFQKPNGKSNFFFATAGEIDRSHFWMAVNSVGASRAALMISLNAAAKI